MSTPHDKINHYFYGRTKMRKPIVSIGEIGVSVGERDYLFRPSLAAMDSLGSPAEIVEKFTILFEPPKINPIWPVQSYRTW